MCHIESGSSGAWLGLTAATSSSAHWPALALSLHALDSRACEASGPGCWELQQDQERVYTELFLPLSATQPGRREGDHAHSIQ